MTESAVMRDVITAANRLDALKALGVGIGVDDFGEGHSSLAYLAALPLDLLKIPKSFGHPGANSAWSGRSSSWPARSASTPPPKGSRSPSSSRCCRSWAAS